MRKVKSHKGFIIATNNGLFFIFTADEWAQGAGYREVEWEAGSLQEAIDWIG